MSCANRTKSFTFPVFLGRQQSYSSFHRKQMFQYTFLYIFYICIDYRLVRLRVYENVYYLQRKVTFSKSAQLPVIMRRKTWFVEACTKSICAGLDMSLSKSPKLTDPFFPITKNPASQIWSTFVCLCVTSTLSCLGGRTTESNRRTKVIISLMKYEADRYKSKPGFWNPKQGLAVTPKPEPIRPRRGMKLFTIIKTWNQILLHLYSAPC